MRFIQKNKRNRKEMYQSEKLMKSNKGFTFIESMFQLIVLLLFSQFFGFIYSWFHQIDSNLNSQEATWEMFIFELQQYINDSSEVTLPNANSVVHLENKQTGEVTQISRYGDMIRKQVDDKGHVPLLMGVKKVTFEKNENTLTISVQFTDGKTKERSFFVGHVEE